MSSSLIAEKYVVFLINKTKYWFFSSSSWTQLKPKKRCPPKRSFKTKSLLFFLACTTFIDTFPGFLSIHELLKIQQQQKKPNQSTIYMNDTGRRCWWNSCTRTFTNCLIWWLFLCYFTLELHFRLSFLDRPHRRMCVLLWHKASETHDRCCKKSLGSPIHTARGAREIDWIDYLFSLAFQMSLI